GSSNIHAAGPFARPLCFARPNCYGNLRLLRRWQQGPPLAGDRKSDIITSDRIAKAVTRSVCMKFSRRSVLRATASSLVAPAFGALGAALPQTSAFAQTQPQVWRHALSLFGDIKYPEGFKHFEYVNPNAPQGGAVRQSAFGTFDNFNMV